MDDYISRYEHNEFVKRMQDEHSRQNRRIADIEKVLEQNNQLLISVDRLAQSMEIMQKELCNQGEKIAVLEGRDGESWRKFTGYLISAAVGAVICYIFSQIGM